VLLVLSPLKGTWRSIHSMLRSSLEWRIVSNGRSFSSLPPGRFPHQAILSMAGRPVIVVKYSFPIRSFEANTIPER
jgi:hypothetical protein